MALPRRCGNQREDDEGPRRGPTPNSLTVGTKGRRPDSAYHANSFVLRPWFGVTSDFLCSPPTSCAGGPLCAKPVWGG